MGVLNLGHPAKRTGQPFPREHRYEEFHQGIYHPEFSRRTYQALFDRAGDILQAGKSVLIDASFKKQTDRMDALELARRRQAEFLLIECRCSEEGVRRRLNRRASGAEEFSDGRWEIYRDQQKDFEKVEGMELTNHVILDTEASVEESLQSLFRYLLKGESVGDGVVLSGQGDLKNPGSRPSLGKASSQE